MLLLEKNETEFFLIRYLNFSIDSAIMVIIFTLFAFCAVQKDRNRKFKVSFFDVRVALKFSIKIESNL
jgi:hypothetical protein